MLDPRALAQTRGRFPLTRVTPIAPHWHAGVPVAMFRFVTAPGELVKKLFGGLGSFIGSTIGWWLGAKIGGTMTAFMISMVGTGFGIYYGVKYAKKYD